MNRDRGEQVGSRRPWPRLGLLLMALILGHDALMAMEAVAAPHGTGATMHHVADPHAAPDDTSPAHASVPAPQHPDNCGVGLSALPRSGEDAGVDYTPSPIECVTASSAPPLGDVAAFAWQEPHWPPGRLRALVQVYRM